MLQTKVVIYLTNFLGRTSASLRITLHFQLHPVYDHQNCIVLNNLKDSCGCLCKSLEIPASSGLFTVHVYVQVSKQLSWNLSSSNDWDPVCLHNKLLENVISLQALTNSPSDSPPL